MAVGVAAVLALVVSAGQAGTPDAGAYVWAVALGALMLWRRRYPRGVLALTVLGMFAYYAAGYPAIGVAVPVAAALFSAAEAGHRRAAIAAGGVVLTVSATFRLLDGQDFRYVVLYEAIGHLALMAAAVALGELVRARRRIDALMSRQVAMAAERRIGEHRQALSRELHDSIGHTLTVAAIHTNVARQEAARDPAATRAALDQVAAAVSQALTDLRGAVRDLRTEPAPSVEHLEQFAESARLAGFTVRSHIEPVAEPAVSATAFRLVREAVTNAMRYSTGRTIDVEVRHSPDALLVRVADDGTPDRDTDPAGTGLAGLRDEVTALGGRLDAGPAREGWLVAASLPLRGHHD
ncbi:two-component sensor histidine kinase [Paractinoplanes rishiriensis]|uniref:histidine kinase n=2 Tax=Paractinoplanes rishiriensis TaxID=1050105 RepID=A0A919KAU2_9ACTN|nr:two-component sensor histidine kinase [Actinoplanes rishiriensis]